MQTIRKFSVSGFKSIAEQELELTDLNVMVGPNGSGKSNLINVFRFLNRIVSRNLQLYVSENGGAERFLYHGQKVTSQIKMAFEFGLNSYSFVLKPAIGDTLIFYYECIYYYGFYLKPDWSTVIGTGTKESSLEEEAKSGRGQVSQHVLAQVTRWIVYHFHDTSKSAPSKNIGNIDDNRFLRPDAANLAAFLYWMRQTHETEYRQIVEHIRLVAPFFDDFSLEPSRLNPNTIKLEWRQQGSDAYFDGFSLSDGTLRFICLATLLLQPELSSVVLLDEPELGLHPYAIAILADMLEAAARRSQVIVATQSVTLLNQFSPEVIIVSEHDGKKTSFKRLAEEDLSVWLQDYSLGDLWEKNIIGGRP